MPPDHHPGHRLPAGRYGVPHGRDGHRRRRSGADEQGKLKLTYLPDSSTLITGDLIVTSGLGGYYPYGLTIGSVEDVRTDDGGLARYAVLEPRCDPEGLTDLYIITDFEWWSDRGKGDAMTRRASCKNGYSTACVRWCCWRCRT